MKSSKKRECPVAERIITPAECGEHRQTKWKCPDSCPFNPWSLANYDQGLDIYDAIQPQLYSRLKPATVQRMDALFHSSPGPGRDVRIQELVDHALYLELDAEGFSIMTRWQRDQWAGLRNDARVQAEAFLGLRIALIEVHRILDDRQMEVVDLLRPGIAPFIVCDYSAVSRAVRFDTYLMLLWEAPHYTRMMGVAMPFETHDAFSPLDIVRLLARHQGAPEAGEALAQWIRLHFHDLWKAVGQLRKAQTRQMIAGLDVRPVTTFFHVKKGRAKEVLSKLRKSPEAESYPPSCAEIEKGFLEVFDWFDGPLGSDTHPTSLGVVNHGNEGFQLYSLSETRMAALREKFETLAGDAVTFHGEKVEDMATQILSRRPDLVDNENLIPPELLAQQRKISATVSRAQQTAEPMSPRQLEEAAYERHTRTLLEESIPMLGDMTPAKAAKDPAIRPVLLTWAKMQIRGVDLHNLQRGTNIDINWMVEELGLTEIAFPPPPPREIPEELQAGAGEESWDEPDDEEWDVTVPDLPPSPLLDPEALSENEVKRRIQTLISQDNFILLFEERLLGEAPDLLSEAKALAEEIEMLPAMAFLITGLVWCLFCPAGTRPEDFEASLLTDYFDEEVSEIFRISKKHKEANLEDVAALSGEPWVFRLVASLALDGLDSRVKEVGDIGQDELERNQTLIPALALAMTALVSEELGRRA